MTRKLFINGSTGKIFISDATISDTQAEDSPIANREHLYFHSELPYIAVAQKINANVTFPEQAVGTYEPPPGGNDCGGLC
jgi:hypothetical protein